MLAAPALQTAGTALAFVTSSNQRKEPPMLRASITLFFIGIIAMLFGMYSIAGVSFEIGRLLLFVFLALAIVGFLAAMITGRKSGTPLL